MNAIEILKLQHEQIDTLFKTIESARDRRGKQAAFIALADLLAAHAKIEEVLFYPAVMARKTEDNLLESVEEHLGIKRALADLLELDCEDVHFDAKLSVMKEAVEHHAHDEEESELFPVVTKLLSKDELDGLGGELLAMYAELSEGKPRVAVPSETERAAPLPGL